jgi:hypothetical protein
MNKDHLAEIAAPMHPPHHDGSLASIFRAQLPAGMRASQIAKEIELQGLFWFRHLCFLFRND